MTKQGYKKSIMECNKLTVEIQYAQTTGEFDLIGYLIEKKDKILLAMEKAEFLFSTNDLPKLI